ncbi:MAG TPA: hypothetical protein VGN16_21800 [Acidobacteriaceae bacterium]|jgi:hypothetical protein
MRKFVLNAILIVITLASASYMLGQQQRPAIPLSEHTLVAGDPLEVVVDLSQAAKQGTQITVFYLLSTAIGTPQQRLAPRIECDGYFNEGELSAKLKCATTTTLPAGEYRVADPPLFFITSRGVQDHARDVLRFPIITIVEAPKPPPLPPIELPKTVNAHLSLSASASLSDGAFKTQDLVKKLNAYFTGHTVDNRATRAYLREMIEDERTIVRNTRVLYQSALPSEQHIPVTFEDFDRRLSRIIHDELGGHPRQLSLQRGSMAPHLVLAQMPQTSITVTANDKPGTLDKPLRELTIVLTDVEKGFFLMSSSGATGFTWSIKTEPEGAEVWISRLDEPETPWTGHTNLKGQVLEYADWTFRVSWDGCSKELTPDPYLQNPLNLEFVKTGCVRK